MKNAVYKLPQDFIERMQKIFPPTQFARLMHTFTEKRPTTFRVNTLKANRQEAIEKLKESGMRLERVNWYADAFILRNSGKKELMETSCYKEGAIYIQNLSSMIPPLVLKPLPEDNVLDLTAAPGSKTTQMAAMMENRGKIVAIDLVKDRFFKLLANLKEQGVNNTQAVLGNGETAWLKYAECFDKVLLDAPCSTEGRFDTTNPKTFVFWKEKKIKEMFRKQKRLLFSALHSLKIGGSLVYSTCTYAPEENEEIINWALTRFGGQIALERINIGMPNVMAGLSGWKNNKFLPEVRNCLRVLPNSDMEGFFVCLIRKKESLPRREENSDS